MFRQDSTFADVPDGQCAGISMYQSAQKPRSYLLNRNVTKVLHVIFFRKYRKCARTGCDGCGKVDKLLWDSS